MTENKEVDTMRYVQDHLDADIDSIMDNEGIDMGNINVPKFDCDGVFKRIMKNTYESHNTYLKRFFVVAAVVTLLLSISGLVIYLLPSSAVEYNEVYAAKGEHLVVILADGSRIDLNSDSKLTYPKEFVGDTRKVTIEGEGYFNISKDKSKPFIVESYDMKIRVTGTQFNVKAYPEDSEITTTLDEGSILIGQNVENANMRPLRPGEEAVFVKGEDVMKISKIANSKEASSWKLNQFYFHDTPLKSILNTLERKFDVKFEIKNKRALEYTYTINCGSVSIDDAISMMTAVTPVNFEKVKDNLYIIK